MDTSESYGDLKAYLIDNFQEIEHPAEPYDASRRFSMADIQSAVDALLALLKLPTAISDARDLERQVVFSLNEYLRASSRETERCMRAAGHLAERLEPFLKKLFAMRHPGDEVPDSFARLLKADVAGYRSKLEYKPTDEKMLAALRLQRTEEAIIHDSYYIRNTWAHKAKPVSPYEVQRCWQSVVAAFLLIAERNLDLVPDVRKRAERTAQIRSGLGLCLENIRGAFDDAKWHSEYYIDLNIDRGGMLDDYVDAFLESQTDRLLVVAGRTGAGKSTFLERRVTQLANEALHSLGTGVSGHVVVPVHLELKRYVPSKRAYLVKKLYNAFDPNVNLGIRTRRVTSWPLFVLPNHLVMCLDGLDEVWSEARQTVVSEVDELLADFDNVRVVVTSRPHAVPEHWNESLVHIMPLPREEVIAYFEHPERLNLLARIVQDFLEARPDLIDTLQDPLMAEAACRYWRQFEPSDSETSLDPSTRREALLEGPLLDHLYKRFFSHHLRRTSGKQITRYERVRQVSALARLALEMDGDPLANFEFVVGTFGRFSSGMATGVDLSELFVDIGLLEPLNNGFAFRNETIKAYFAAVGLQIFTQGGQVPAQTLSLIRKANGFWHRCVKLLKEIAPLYDVGAIEGHLALLARA